MPFFPLGGFTPLQSAALSAVATRLESAPMSVATAWLLRRSPNILRIPGTSSVAHLREYVVGAGLSLSGEVLADLDKIGRQQGLRNDVPESDQLPWPSASLARHLGASAQTTHRHPSPS